MFSKYLWRGYDLSGGRPVMQGGVDLSYNDESDSSVGDYRGWHNYELSASLDYTPLDNLTVSPAVLAVLLFAGLSDQARAVLDSQTNSGVNVTFAF